MLLSYRIVFIYKFLFIFQLFTQKKQAVPYFASGLSILEPIRGGADSKNSRHTMAPATLLGTSRLDQSQNITSVQVTEDIISISRSSI